MLPFIFWLIFLSFFQTLKRFALCPLPFAPLLQIHAHAHKKDLEKPKRSEALDSDFEWESDHSAHEIYEFFEEFRHARHVSSWIWPNLRRVKDYLDELYCMAWWCAIRELDNYYRWIAYLQLNGWTAPNGLDAKSKITEVTPVMDGHFLLTKLAVELLMDFWALRRPDSDFDPLSLTLDQMKLSRELNYCQAKGYSKYQISMALAATARAWNGKRKYFYKNFRRVIKKYKINITIYSFDCERSDQVPSGDFRDLRGCVPEHDFAALSAAAQSKDATLNTQQQHGEAEPHAPQPQVNQNNNNNNNINADHIDGNDRSGYFGSNLFDPNDNGFGPTEPAGFGHFAHSRGSNNLAASNMPAPLQQQAPPQQQSQPSQQSQVSGANQQYSDVARNNVAQRPSTLRGHQRDEPTGISPSGRPYPPASSVPFPKTVLLTDLFAPKLRYFAGLSQLPLAPTFTSYDDYKSRLGRCMLNYCADWNAGNCRMDECVLHHLCEWCASAEHRGNDCPYRPAGLNLRKVGTARRGDSRQDRRRYRNGTTYYVRR